MERETFVGSGTVILLTVKIRCPGGTAAEAQAFLPSPTDTGGEPKYLSPTPDVQSA